MTFVPSSDSGGSPGRTSTSPSGSGGSAGSASGGSSSVAIPSPGSGGAAQLTNLMIDVSRLTADRTEYGPPIFVGPNDVVSVVPRRGNSADCFVSTMGNSDAKFPPRLQLKNTDNPVFVGVRTLKEIGVYSTVVGEGVTIMVQRRPM